MPCLLASLCALSLSQFAQRASLDEPTAPYEALTNDFRERANFNVETVRGLALGSDGRLYALNTHGSTIVVHADADVEPEAVWPTLNNPVSLAVFGERVAVVGGGTHALAIHDRADGRVLDVLGLPREPADLVVDQTAEGWTGYVVSQAENAVVEIDLVALRILRRWSIPSESPRFLSLDTDPDSLVRRLLVAPMLSGNNSVPVPASGAFSATLDEALGNVFGLSPIGGLGDEDLFAISIDEPDATVVPVAREAGTLLLEHGRNPLTHEYWMLAVDSHNDLLEQRSEAELKGDFANNTLAILAAGSLGTPCTPFCPTPDRIVDLDDADPAPDPQYARDTSCSFPYALAFVPESSPHGLVGFACIASSTGDLLVFLDPDGVRLAAIDLPERGMIPRDLLIDPTGALLFVHCWGTNEVLVYLVTDLLRAPLRLELGLDPADERIRAGRRIWYDARPSLDGRVSCNTCHPDGRSDLLGWKLSDVPADHKDVMVTQSLRSILDTPAYHWREERFLPDFNVAFPGLLGHDQPLDQTELANFDEFVFSLQAHANHRQNENRVLDDRLAQAVFRNGLAGSAVRGQEIFLTVPSLGANTCADCHTLPNGTQGRELFDAASVVPTAMNMGVAHLRQLNHKDQPRVELAGFGFARGGFGVLHNGQFPNAFEFISAPFFALTPQQASDVTAFVQQFDQGISPGAHAAVLLDERGTRQRARRIVRSLFSQAQKNWIDVVAHGTLILDGSELALRWLYDPTSELLIPHTTSVAPITLARLVELSEQGLASNLFLGLPWGEGRSWALDPDNDELLDEEEQAQGTDPSAKDTDGDGFPDGYEVEHGSDPLSPNPSVPDGTPPVASSGFPRLDHVTAGYAKFFLETDEPVTVEVQTRVLGGPVHVTATFVPARRQTVVIQGLDPSTANGRSNPYTAEVRMLDLSGNVATALLPFTTDTNVTAPGELHVNDFSWVTEGPMFPGFDGKAEILVEEEANAPFPAPAVAEVAVLQVLYRVRSDGSTGNPELLNPPWSIASNVASLFRADGFQVRTVDAMGNETIAPYAPLAGPFLLSPLTDAAGRAQLDFFFPGPLEPLPPGTTIEVRLDVLAILTPSPGYDPANAVFESSSLFRWKMPSTDKGRRGIESSYPGP